MYFRIQVWVSRLAIIRSCGMVMACRPALPPGASSRSMAPKYSCQWLAPTASIISTLTMQSKLPVTSR